MSALPRQNHPHAEIDAPAEAALPRAGRTALLLHAGMLAASSVQDAAQSLVVALARREGFSRVCVALDSDGGAQGRATSLRLAVVSDGSDTTAQTALNLRLTAACAEAFDQAAVVCWPPVLQPPSQPPSQPTLHPSTHPLSHPPTHPLSQPHLHSPFQSPTPLQSHDTLPRITRAHEALADSHGAVAGLPLVAAGRPIGVLLVERSDGPAFDAATLQTLEHLAGLAAPLLALMRANERALHRRVIDDIRAWWAPPLAPRRRLLRRSGAAAAVLVVAALLWPVQAPVGGRARLEGAVQRVLVAPADGFVQQVHARPGDLVRAGQPLIDLAEQDLQLERLRWQSQLAQQLDALASAQARADRAQLVQLQARADEAQAQLDLVDERLLRSRLVAPFDGIVVQGDLSQQLGAPVKVGAELMTVAPSDRFRVIVEIDERDIAQVHAGQRGRVTLSALPWQATPMQIVRITPVATVADGRNVFEVEAALLESAAGLRPGLQGSAQIVVGEASTLWRWTRRLVESAKLTAWEWFG